MKKIISVICVLLTLFSCKSEKKIVQVEPEYVLKKWSKAIKSLDYERYVECEAHPKPHEEFLKMYKDYYFEEMQINTIDKILEKTESDNNSNKYNKCELIFDCVMVNRKNSNVKKRINGSIDFIKFIDLPKSKQGWLMFNRTLIETK
jgi:hypothetical protein